MGAPWVLVDLRARRVEAWREAEVWKKRSLSVVMDMAGDWGGELLVYKLMHTFL